VRPKAEDLVEAGGRRVVRAQAQAIESTARRSDHLGNQLPAYSVAAHRRQHVQVTDPADPRVARVGIDVESAHAHESPGHPRAEQRLARPVEAVGPSGPLVDEAPDDPRSGFLAFDEQLANAVRRQLDQPLDQGGLDRLPPWSGR